MFLFPEGRCLNEFSRPRIRPTTPEFGSKRTPHLRSTVPNVQRHMAYFAEWRQGSSAGFVIALSCSFPTSLSQLLGEDPNAWKQFGPADPGNRA